MPFPLSDLLIPSRKDKKKLYGTKPEYTSPETSAATALRANLANLPQAQELGTKVNTYNQAELMAMLRRAIPGFDTKIALQSGLLESGLRGEVPADVAKQVGLRAASRAVAGGYAGSGMARNLEARDFGRTSWDITQQSLDSTSRWTQAMAQLTQPAMFNIGSAFIPYESQRGHDELVAENKAAYNPGTRGAFDSKMATLGMMLGVYGGAGYQGAANRPSTPTGPQPSFVPQYSTVSGRLAPSSPGFGSGGIYE